MVESIEKLQRTCSGEAPVMSTNWAMSSFSFAAMIADLRLVYVGGCRSVGAIILLRGEIWLVLEVKVWRGKEREVWSSRKANGRSPKGSSGTSPLAKQVTSFCSPELRKPEIYRPQSTNASFDGYSARSHILDTNNRTSKHIIAIHHRRSPSTIYSCQPLSQTQPCPPTPSPSLQ